VLAKATKTKHITLVAVSKTKPVSAIQEAYDAGHRAFGENYVDEFVEKHSQLPADIKWHFIGHIQSNKVKKLVTVPNLDLVETVDSEKLAAKLNKEYGKAERKEPLRVLVQVLTSTEGTKFGVEEGEGSDKLVEYIVKECPKLKFAGLMTMGRLHDVEAFRRMYEMKEKLRETHKLGEELVLSMGTSDDWEEAVIEGGANEVRLGTTIFGARDYSKQ